MSAIQLLEKIGASAALRYTKNEALSATEIQNLIDVCPDIVAYFAPAEEDGESEDEPQEDDDEKESIKIASGF
jgi:hypothetical protein